MTSEIELHNSNPQDKPTHTIRDTVIFTLIAFFAIVGVRLYITEPFVVDGASMDPTFASGQYLIVDKVSYDFEKPARGDVIIFKYPADVNLDFIKRVIGLPGETVRIRNGIVTISNGSSTPFTLTETYVQNDHKAYDSITTTLGPAEYFVMGDNRAQSSDSRRWGPVPSNLIIGRPIARLFPPAVFSIFPGRITE